jgi:radical SAM protein with 4Fe4S-binding SPASM domain
MNLLYHNPRNLVSTYLNNTLSHLRYGDRFPGNINIETSTFCNRSCYYCANHTDPYPKQEHISEEVMNRILSELVDMRWTGIISLNFTNEPLLDETIFDSIACLRQACPQSRIIIYTNGDFLTETVFQDLRKFGLSELWVTEHPPSTQHWRDRIEAIRRKHPWQIAVRNIEFSNLLHNYTGRSSPLKTAKMKKCTIARNSIQILYNGDVILCCACPRTGFVQGNVMKTGLLDIWRDSPWRKVREAAMNGKPKGDMCRKCMGV